MWESIFENVKEMINLVNNLSTSILKNKIFEIIVGIVIFFEILFIIFKLIQIMNEKKKKRKYKAMQNDIIRRYGEKFSYEAKMKHLNIKPYTPRKEPELPPGW